MNVDLNCLKLNSWANPNAEHLQWQDTLRQFVEREITPNAQRWDEAETFPIDLYRKAGAFGNKAVEHTQQHLNIERM